MLLVAIVVVMVVGTGAVVCDLADWSGKRTQSEHSLRELPSPLPSRCFPYDAEWEASRKGRGRGLLIERLIEK